MTDQELYLILQTFAKRAKFFQAHTSPNLEAFIQNSKIIYLPFGLEITRNYGRATFCVIYLFAICECGWNTFRIIANITILFHNNGCNSAFWSHCQFRIWSSRASTGSANYNSTSCGSAWTAVNNNLPFLFCLILKGILPKVLIVYFPLNLEFWKYNVSSVWLN